MADPEGYEPRYDFSDYQSTNPSRPLPGHELDVELHNISAAFGQTNTALGDIRRSDGKLQNGLVGVDALAPGLRPDGAAALAAANAAALSAAQAALYEGVWADTIADLRADTALTYTAGQPGAIALGDYVRVRVENSVFEVAAAGASDHHLMTAGGVKLYVSAGQAFVTPRMFGAAGDGAADDLAPMRACWDYAGANKVPVHMEGREYNCSDAVYTSSNLTVFAHGATMYITAWPTVGGFINNVRPVAAERVQANIRIHDLITDGSKLPAPGATQNTNLGPEFGRGASNVRVVNCTARKIREGGGGGTGGGGFGGEQGLDDVQFIGCVAEDCFRGARVAGIPGEHSPGVPRNAVGVVFRDLVARRCGTAVFCHSVGHAGDSESDLEIFDVLFDGLYAENCGHSPWLPFDFSLYPTIPAQKTGVINFGGAQNIRMRGVRVKFTAGYPSLHTDWLGRTGYPASGNFIGAGLSGAVGALVWGHGRNCVIEDITLDGSVDAFWQCNRAIAFGDLATVGPTEGADGSVAQVVFEDIRHVRPGAYNYVFEGQADLNNTRFSGRMRVAPGSNPTIGVIGPTGTAALSNLLVEIVANNGPTQRGNAVEWLADGNARPSNPQRRHDKGGYDVGGGFSGTGLRRGQTFDAAAGIRRSSQNTAGSGYHDAFYNTNGLVGAIVTNASSTRFFVTSTTWVTGGPGSPEGVVAAPLGCMWLRTDGGATTTLYVKTSGAGNTGWTAK